MWEKCVGCGEGLFAGDAFCGNCGRATQDAATPEPAGPEASGDQAGPASLGPAARAERATIPAARRGEAGSGLIRIYARPADPDGEPVPEAPPGLPPAPRPASSALPAADTLFPVTNAGPATPAITPVADGATRYTAGPVGTPPSAGEAPPPAASPPLTEPLFPDEPLPAGSLPPAGPQLPAGSLPPAGPQLPAEPQVPAGPLPSVSPLPPAGPLLPAADPVLPPPESQPATAAVTPEAAPGRVRPAVKLNLPGTRYPAATPDDPPPESTAPAPSGVPSRTRLAGPSTFDPASNTGFLRQVLRQAVIYGGLYVLIETATLLCFLAVGAAGMGLGDTMRLEIISLISVALVLAIPFWLIPVSALLGQWTMLAESRADTAKETFQRMSLAFSEHEIPVDSLEIRTVQPDGEPVRDYLEVRRDRFCGLLSCFPHGRDLYLGWTFWLRMSPARLLLLIVGRRLRHPSGRGDIEEVLSAEPTRALVAALHTAALVGTGGPAHEPEGASGDGGRDVVVRVS
jgi:hypothetical protein